VRYNIDIWSPLAEGDLHSYFRQVISLEPVSIRDLRFALNQLRRIEDNLAVSWLLENAASYPHAMKVIGNSPVRAFSDMYLIVSKVLISARRA
jgi:hypothetical protein